MERKPRYMEPVKLVKREDSLAYARRHDGNGDGILQSTEQPNQWQTANRGQWGNDDDSYHYPMMSMRLKMTLIGGETRKRNTVAKLRSLSASLPLLPLAQLWLLVVMWPTVNLPRRLARQRLRSRMIHTGAMVARFRRNKRMPLRIAAR